MTTPSDDGSLRDRCERLEREVRTLDKAKRHAERGVTRLERLLARTEANADRDRAMMRHAHDELERAAADAEGAARAKSVFLATMSHELRTPMSGVLGLLDLVLTSKLDAEQRSYIETAMGSARTLLTLLDDILDFSKIEAGQTTTAPRPVRPRELLEDLAAVHAADAYGKGVGLWTVVPTAVPQLLELDGQHVRQIVGNLVSNAIKFTDQGEVTVEARWEGGAERLEIAVEDTGIGIDAQRVDTIFEPFHQADGSITRRFGGTGLGLAIVRELTALNGGTLHVSSQPQRGSRFVVRLPAKRLTPDTTLPRPCAGRRVGFVATSETMSRSLVPMLAALGCEPSAMPPTTTHADAARAGLDALIAPPRHFARQGWPRRGEAVARVDLIDPWHDEESDASSHSATRRARLLMPMRQRQLEEVLGHALSRSPRLPTRTPTSPLSTGEYRAIGGRVLIVEDNAVNRLVARRLVERQGFVCDVVGDGAQALASVRARRYDVVLMDCQMPVMDGYTATRRIHEALPRGERPVIIALTASAMKEDRQRCIDAGMDDYLSKPIDPRVLERLLARCCLRSGRDVVDRAS